MGRKRGNPPGSTSLTKHLALVTSSYFRGGGDTRFGFFLDVTFMWGISIVLGFIAAFILELPAIIVAFILYFDEIIKIPFSTWRYKSYKWLNDVTRK